MTQILVRPTELRQAAEQLHARAQRLSQAMQNIDQAILSVKGDRFLGHRADAVQAHYAPKRSALLKAKDIVLQFSQELEQAATVFERADKTGNPEPAPAPSPAPKPDPGTKQARKMPAVKDFALNQWDSRWRDIKMNNQTGETLKNYGCLMTVISMIARIYGVETNPALVDKWIEAHGGYPANGSYMPMNMQVGFLNDVLDKKGSMSTIYSENPTQHGLLNVGKHLEAGRPVILHIESPINPKDGHFVLAVGTDANGNYICADPNGGKQVTIEADSIRSARVYQ